MKQHILKDNALNEELQSQGFVVTNFCSTTLIEESFKKVLSQNKEVNLLCNNNQIIDVPFHCTFLDHDKFYKKQIWKILTNLIEPFLTETFIDYKIIQANLFNKAPGTGFITPHQNLTTVDEEKYTSISIWVPLQNTNSNNGTLHFLPKSHGRFELYRNSNIHWAPMDASNQIDDYKMLPINVNIGQALIFDDSIVHGSPDNNSAENRYVFHYLAIPSKSKPVFCKKIDGHVHLIEVDDMFWQNHTPGDAEPTSPVVKIQPFKPRIYTKENLLDEMDRKH